MFVRDNRLPRRNSSEWWSPKHHTRGQASQYRGTQGVHSCSPVIIVFTLCKHIRGHINFGRPISHTDSKRDTYLILQNARKLHFGYLAHVSLKTRSERGECREIRHITSFITSVSLPPDRVWELRRDVITLESLWDVIILESLEPDIESTIIG